MIKTLILSFADMAMVSMIPSRWGVDDIKRGHIQLIGEESKRFTTGFHENASHRWQY